MFVAGFTPVTLNCAASVPTRKIRQTKHLIKLCSNYSRKRGEEKCNEEESKLKLTSDSRSSIDIECAGAGIVQSKHARCVHVTQVRTAQISACNARNQTGNKGEKIARRQ